MKREKRLTLADKKKKFKTISNWVRVKEEEKRKKKAMNLNREFKNEKTEA